MKCEVEGCPNEHSMSINMPRRFTGTKRICQSCWLKIMKANRNDADELPFKFKEKFIPHGRAAGDER
jgi:hypothetical protein